MKGAGQAIAKRLLAAGATVIVTARNKPEESNDAMHFVPADLSQSGGTQMLQRWDPPAFRLETSRYD